jgi:mannose-6-phosphate isomerase-like protein (cupin superfamily)
MVTNGRLGVDLIRVAAGQGFQPHTHPGDHILIVVGGSGTITYDGVVYPTEAGDLYMIEGEVPHAVGARTDHVILAVGSPHKLVDDLDRMEPLEYQEVLSPLGDLWCLICDSRSTYPNMLHDEGCEHCPCPPCAWNDVGNGHHRVHG